MLTRDEILARKTGKGKCTLPDGSEVEVRGLTRDEVYKTEKFDTDADDGRAARDNYIISTGMVNPKLSPEDVASMGANGNAGDITYILERISELSGLRQGADKSRK
jgi:hypothetical protein